MPEFAADRVNPPGYESTTDNLFDINVTCGTTTHDFGDRIVSDCPRGINGVVWHDVDADGLIDADESPLAGSTLMLLDSVNTFVAEQVTKADGLFVFGDLDSDVYSLIETNPVGYSESTTPDNWGVDMISCRIVSVNFGNRAAPRR